MNTSKIEEYIALDVETTGLSPENNAIIEIAAIKFSRGEVIDEFVTLVNPNCFLPKRITEITGITSSMLHSAPTYDDIIDDFLNFIGDWTIVMHNKDFDTGFISAMCEQYGHSFTNDTLCTLRLSRQLLPALKNHKLGTVCQHFNVVIDGAHRAKADAIATGEIFWYLTAILNSANNANPTNYADIMSAEPMQDQLKAAATAADNTLTVSQLNRYIKGLLENNPNLNGIAVVGEISNFKRHFSGHLYFSLKDDAGVIRCVMFKNAASGINFNLADGVKIIARGHISLYEATGQYQLYIEDMQEFGKGDLHIKFEELKKKLNSQGFFADERKQPIPRFPKKIGIVTSPTGSVIKDIYNVATRRYPYAKLLLYPAKVQGEGGAEQIIEGINYFDKSDVDTIIIGRGGGSIEDLWNFNEESVAMAIVSAKTPIISAVGHETDFTIADFVADLRAPTPSAAAELAVPSTTELKDILKNQYLRMYKSIKNNVEHKRNILDRFRVKTPIDVINHYRLQVDNIFTKLHNSVGAKMQIYKTRLSVASTKLDGLSPLGIISRGYSVAQVNGKTVKNIGDVNINSTIETLVSNGKIISQVKEVIAHERYKK
ncbi:MAG: exodeoxyribonuclease VII large subunit [Clostridiales bacterium]|jgi:exodeoxyribonuclease VII large subunit|nr:exodeoxyribonuclease VII large subunit [Clostridiales bacterium]